jgi:hypothetical protein
MMELFLSSDGKHTVHAAADTPEQLLPLLPQARTIYEQVVAQFGTKPQMWQGANGQSKPEGPGQSNAPECPEHGRKMIFRRSRFGGFWSCPTRTPDGQWCRYTVDEAANGRSRTG